MEGIQQQEKMNYIKKLALLQIQKKEMEQMLEDSIKNNNNPLLCCLVNRDIIDNYKKLYLYEHISHYLNNLKNKRDSYNLDYGEEITAIFKKIGVDDDKLLLSEQNSLPTLPIFFETEKLKIHGYEYPYNFSILKKELLDLLLDQNESEISGGTIKSNCTKIYKVLIGKEGIFIWSEEKQKEYIIIYYLDNLSSEINKIYLYKKEEEFLNELNKIIIGKTKKDYFRFRSIKNKEIGFYNLIEDGKIISKYINIMQSENFKEDESVDLKAKFDNIIVKAEEKNEKIECFLENLLINLYYINNLREICNNKLDLICNQNNEKSLLESFSDFVKENMSSSGNNINFGNNNKIREKAKNFVKIFFDNNLGENVIFDEQHENRGYENLIVKIIETFKKDLKKKNNIENMPTKIEELFYGIRQSENGYEYFNTLYINQNKIITDKKTNVINVDLFKIIKVLTLEETGIINLPEKLILILDNNEINEEKSIIKAIPLELLININQGSFNQRYIFLSSIQNNGESSSKFSSIIKKQKNFFKIDYNSINNSYQEYQISEKEISKSFIFFYERMKESEYSSGNGNIYDSTNSQIDLSGKLTQIFLSRYYKK